MTNVEAVFRFAVNDVKENGHLVGVGRFELPTSSSRTKRANRAALHPEKNTLRIKTKTLKTNYIIVQTPDLPDSDISEASYRDVLTGRSLSRFYRGYTPKKTY